MDHHKFGEMFIVCGHLYAIDSCTDKNSQIRYAVDLYQGKLLNVNLPFTNPFSKTTTVGYNPYTVVSKEYDNDFIGNNKLNLNVVKWKFHLKLSKHLKFYRKHSQMYP